jgi:hypothetical protein
MSNFIIGLTAENLGGVTANLGRGVEFKTLI